MLSTKPRYMLTRDGRFVRFFRFEDLEGKAEPAAWGPCYPKTASAAVEKWRAIARGRELEPGETALYGQSVGEWIRALNAPKGAARVSLACTAFNAAAHRAKLRAAFAAQAAADRRAWALGLSKNERGETIAQAYARAMREKALRLAGQTVPEPERMNPQPAFKPAKPAKRKAVKARELEAA
jgi:hypothetical protein